MPSSAFFGMQHLNTNVLCSVFIEQTSPDPLVAEPLEICILPLDQFFKPHPHPDFAMFNMRMKPQFKENVDPSHIKMTRQELAQVILNSWDADKVSDLLEDWFQRMDLPEKKRLLPLTFDWPKQRQGLIDWLGYSRFTSIFSEDYRDVRVAAHWVNDKLATRGEPVFFSKQNLPWLSTKLNCERLDNHGGSPVSDCWSVAQIYHNMLKILT